MTAQVNRRGIPQLATRAALGWGMVPFVVVATAVFLAAQSAAFAATNDPAVVIERNVPAAMRDGVVLRANIHRPSSGGPYPVLLMRTPYGKQAQKFEQYVKAGYIVVCKDVRGRYASDGTWESFIRPKTHDAEDGYDSVQWAATLPGASGKVGTIGLSYSAFLQWRLAALRSPSLVAMSARSIAARHTDIEGPGTIRPGRRLRWWIVTMTPDLRLRANRPGTHTEPEAAALWDAGQSQKWLQFLPWLDLAQEACEDETPHTKDSMRNPTLDPWKLDAACSENRSPRITAQIRQRAARRLHLRFPLLLCQRDHNPLRHELARLMRQDGFHTDNRRITDGELDEAQPVLRQNGPARLNDRAQRRRLLHGRLPLPWPPEQRRDKPLGDGPPRIQRHASRHSPLARSTAPGQPVVFPGPQSPAADLHGRVDAWSFETLSPALLVAHHATRPPFVLRD